MRRAASGGFAVIGAASTVVWAISLVTAKHHRSIWELLAFGLGCFLVAALVEIYARGRTIQRYQGRSDLIDTLNAISQEGRELAASPTMPAPGAAEEERYRRWRDDGEARIAVHDPGYAHEFAEPENENGYLPERLAARLELLKGIARAARTGGSHILAPTDGSSSRLASRLHALRG